jgi:predicted MFS family arabinose efflux permease/ribosomal protein S18 acetylase RimI-like enzyme
MAARPHSTTLAASPTLSRQALASPSLVLFLAFVASQAGVLVLSPILSDVADDFGVSIAAAGQLRILAAPLAVVAALVAGRLLTRYSPRALLGVASALLAVGSLASAAAPSFALLALAQIPMWIGIAMILTAGVAATAAWSEPERRTRVVAHAFAGPPTAWIVGMPLIGLVAEVNWRLAFLALPLPAALLAGLAVLGRPHDAPIPRAETSLHGLLRRADAQRWAIGELCANAAWAGTLVFSGALMTEQFGMSTTATGVALAAVAVAYLLGNRRAGHGAPERARWTMLATSLAAAVAVALTWTVTPVVAVTLVLFAVSGALVATRTVSGTVYGFSVAGDLGREVGTVRAVTTQLGYLIGALAGGAALALAGFAGIGVVMGGLFLASTLPYASLRLARRRVVAASEAPAPEALAVSAALPPATMPSRYVPLRRGQGLVIRPLRNGDVETVIAVFERLGDESRRSRFNGPKPQLSSVELEQLARVDATRHVLVGYLAGHARPVAIARLVREGASAEIAFEVADEHQRLGIGTALTEELLADARAAGITEITALVATDNKAAVSLLQRVLGRLDARFEGTELSVRAALAEAMAGTAASPRAGAAPVRGSA